MAGDADPEKLILASASPARREILEKAGLRVAVHPASVDEDSVKDSMAAAKASASDTAMALAELKATRVSGKFSEPFVIGADQILECGDRWFDKPVDLAHAEAHLRSLRGRRHQLATAVCVAKAGSVIWRYLAVPKLTMRDFSDQFLAAYLAQCGDAILASVGAYRLEDRGVQLFNAIDGDYFAVLGLPLLPLLDFLRTHAVIDR